jgi:hypothetical protein
MSLYDKASLVQIPSGTKDGILYSVLPANGDGDFTHARSTSATRVNKDGLIESVASGVPRLDYPLIDGVVQSCPALLLEPSRTNLSLYSQQFNLWSGGLITADQAISPDGNLTADELTKPSAFAAQSRTETGTSGVNYVFSLFVKPKTTNRISLRQASGSNDVRRYFDLSDQSSGQSGGNNTGFVSEGIEKYSNGWYRIHTVCTSNGTAIATNIYSGMAGNTTYDGEFYIWGSQFELGDYPTSYIPTTTSSVTRNFDDCVGAGTSAEFNDSEGVLFAEIQGLSDPPTNNSYVSLTDGTVANSIMIQHRNQSGVGELRIYNGGTGGANMVSRDATADLTENIKIAIQYGNTKANYKVYINGVSQSIASAFVATSMSGLDELKFEYAVGGSNFFGKTKQLMTFNEALTDKELEQVTSWTSFGEMAKGQLYTIE